MSAAIELTPREKAIVECVALRVVELLRAGGAPTAGTGTSASELVDAAAVAVALKCSRQTVYAHAAELGGERIGQGKRARWRFDLDAARAAMACLSSSRSQSETASVQANSKPVRRRRRRRLPNGLPEPGGILAVRAARGRQPASHREEMR